LFNSTQVYVSLIINTLTKTREELGITYNKENSNV